MLLELTHRKTASEEPGCTLPKAPLSRDHSEGADPGPAIEIDRALETQLSKAHYGGAQDQASPDWLIRISDRLSPKEQARLSDAIHRALLHESPLVRAEAVRMLDFCSDMAQPRVLLHLAETHLDLFRGMRRTADPPDIDRGTDFIELVCAVVGGPEGSRFRREMAFDPTYGEAVLPSLVRHEPDWVVEHIAWLVHLDLDPLGFRLHLLLSRLQGNIARLRRLVANLAGTGPALRARLRMLLRKQVRCPELYAELLRILGSERVASEAFTLEPVQICA